MRDASDNGSDDDNDGDKDGTVEKYPLEIMIAIYIFRTNQHTSSNTLFC